MILSCNFCSLPYWVNTVFSTHMGSFTIQLFYLLLSYLMALPLCLEQRLQGYKSNILSHLSHSDLSPGLKTPILGGDLGMAHAAQEEFVETSVDLEGTSLPVPRADPEAVPSPPCDWLPWRAALLCWDTQGETLQKRLQKPLPLHLH